MSDSMSKEALIKSLKESLMDSADLFLDELGELLDIAANDLARVRHRTMVGSVTLKPGEDMYEAPADLREFKISTWGHHQRNTMKPWQRGFNKRQLPTVTVIKGNPKQLVLSCVPGTADIASLGSRFRFYYFANHHLDDDGTKTTVSENERDLLLLRAQAEAMKWLAMRNVDKTVATKHAVSGASKGGVPGALYQLLITDWERRAAC